ncbi:MAG: sensor histidine kinase [Cellulosilyticaceae bacterium]
MKKDWKILIGLVMGIGIMCLLAFVTSYRGYQTIDQLIYEQIAGTVGKVVAQSPESEGVILQSLKQLEMEDIISGKAILKPYGYEEKFLATALAQRGFQSLLQVNLLVMLMIFVSLVILGYSIYRRLQQKFNHLQDYLIQIAGGNYNLNIEGIGEGRFSVFEDQIYKTTVSLRESKEMQEREKLGLAQNIADISHQLKTPLTSMGIMTELLLANEPDDQNQQFIGQLDRQIERLSGLVSVLLKFAKLDAGTVVLKQQTLQVADLVEEVLDMLEVVIKQKGLQICLEGLEAVCLQVDKNWTYEAIHNVIYNCVQHSPEGGRVKIEWSQNPIYTELAIQDEGGGISSADLPHIFTRFYKGQKAAKDSVGIGLAMAQTIIAKQNGEIKAKNVAKGAQFCIKFY